MAATEIYRIPKNQQESFKTEFEQIAWDELLHGTDLDKDCQNLLNKIQQIIAKFMNFHIQEKIY